MTQIRVKISILSPVVSYGSQQKVKGQESIIL